MDTNGIIIQMQVHIPYGPCYNHKTMTQICAHINDPISICRKRDLNAETKTAECCFPTSSKNSQHDFMFTEDIMRKFFPVINTN